MVNAFIGILECDEISMGLMFIESKKGIECAIKFSKLPKMIMCTSNDEIAASCIKMSLHCIKLPKELSFNQEAMKLYCITKSLLKGMVKPDSKLILFYGDGQKETTIELVLPREDIPELQAILEIVSEGISSIEVFLCCFELAFSLASARHPFVKGTMITVGDHIHLMSHSRPFMFEPFQYYANNEKSVLNQSIWKTIERYSRLDSAFILDESGCIQSVVELITPPATIGEVMPGLGSRHSTAASISGQFNCYVLVISQTAGDVSIFLRGNRILKLKNRYR